MCLALAAHAGGPRFVAGDAYFDSAVQGYPVVWAGGLLSYYIDQGPLSSAVNNQTAAATVAAAAAVWNAVPTAAVGVDRGGSLAENVSGENVIATPEGITMPADIESTATNTPVAVVFDMDGSVIDAFYGLGASDPDDCVDSGVITRVDNLAPGGFIAHAVILINGLCTGTADQLEQIEFQLIRAFGRVLGLDWSQANDAVLFGGGPPSLQQLQGWPIMRPVDLNCNQLSVDCVPEPLQLRADDVASISRLYPVITANTNSFPDKLVTQSATISIHGTVHFQRGQGMRGVNVVARPIIPGAGLPDDRYPVTSVSGYLFAGDRGNPVTGSVSSSGPAIAQYGSTDPAREGYYDLSGISLPPGQNQADYLVSLEAVNPLYTGGQSVGPYTLGSPTPSGTLPTLILRGLTAGAEIEQDFTISDSASDLSPGSGGTSSASAIPPTGEWASRTATVGGTSIFTLPVRGGRHFTIEAQALDNDASVISDEAVGALPTENKLRPVLGIWNGSGPASGPPVNFTSAPFNGAAIGVTALGVDAIADGELILGVADQRGDGRPDYVFHGRLLYADQVCPQRLGLNGGTITITGSGFHPGMVIAMQGGSLADPIAGTILGITPTLLVATMPSAVAPSGSLDLVVTDPVTNGIAAIAAGISYGVGSNDTMSIVAAPTSNVSMNIPAPFTVRVFGSDQISPAGAVPVSFSVISGEATYDGASSVSAITTGDGYATASAIATGTGLIKLQASLSNGNSLLAEFTATATPSISALTPSLFLAPGSTWSWTPQVQLWSGASPASGATVAWSGSGIVTNAANTLANAQGVASLSLILGPWAPGSSFTLSACTAGASCVPLQVYTVHPEAEILSAVSGSVQILMTDQSPAPIVMRLTAPGGQPIVSGTVSFTGTIRAWTPACAPGGPCEPGRLLSEFAQTASSAADGSATFSPILTRTPQILSGIAFAGTAASEPFQIEISP
jgi:hypothetical protein